MLKFKIKHVDANSKARTGSLKTNHGLIKTPVFMPVGTQGCVKTLDNQDVYNLKAQIILANTYHMLLQPGTKVLDAFDGLHKLMNIDVPMLTDSGGFQVFSLKQDQKITEEGVYFKNSSNGDKLFISPEISIQIQNSIKSDIMMVFDECPVYPSDYTYLKASAERTLRWAQRSKDANANKDQALFGIVQGGQYSDLRYKSAQDTVKIGFDGYAIGGVALGEPKDVMYKMIEDGIKYLPDNKPRYLMGVGSIDGILEGIQRGVDMFDCVLPTRLARHGAALTHHGRVNIRDKKHEYDANRLDDKCQCSTCQTYSLAYLHHLYKAEELTVKRLLSIHNITFLFDLVANARIAIENDRFNEYKDEVYAEYGIERIQKSGF